MATRAEIFSEWLRRQGYRVIQTPSTYWYEPLPRGSIPGLFPYRLWRCRPTQSEVRGLLQKNRAIALRCYKPALNRPGAISYHVVYEKTSL